MSSYRLAAKDPALELRIKLAYRELPEKHWCRRCPWARAETTVFICPFIEGSCAKLPETINQSNPKLLREKMRAVRRKAAQEGEKRRDREKQPTTIYEANRQQGKLVREKKHELYGRSHTLAEWAELAGMSEDTLRRRMNRGMSLKEAVETPVNEKFITLGKTREADPFIRAMRQLAGKED